MVSLSKKAQKSSESLDAKIQLLKDKQHALETKMVKHLHRVLKSHQGFSLPFPTLMGGFIEVMEQAKADSNQVEAWNASGEKFLRQRIRQPKNTDSKNSSAVPVSTTAMEKTHDEA